MITLNKFDFTHATEKEWQGLNEITNRRLGEVLPDDPPTPLEQTVKIYQNIPPVVDLHLWLALNNLEQVVGIGTAELLNIEENQHMAQGMLFVAKEHRGQAIGKRLFREALQCAAEHERRIYITEAYEHIPEGMTFGQAMGGEIGLSMRISQLDLETVDRNLIAEWLKRGKAAADEFELLTWEGAYPEEDLEQMAAVNAAMNQAPARKFRSRGF